MRRFLGGSVVVVGAAVVEVVEVVVAGGSVVVELEVVVAASIAAGVSATAPVQADTSKDVKTMAIRLRRIRSRKR
jgi:hypothetical protein